MVGSSVKICSKCGIEKAVSEFYIREKSGRAEASCKKCHNVASRKNYSENAEARRRYRKSYYEQHSEICLQYNEAYYKSHREEILEQKKEYTKLHAEERGAYMKEYYKLNAEECRQRKRDWDKKNPGYHSQYCSARSKIDPEFRKVINIRNSIRGALKRGGVKKNSKTALLLGLEIDFFLEGIGKLFWPGMSWDNSHKWELDHIRPCADFDLADPEQQKQCFHFSNWQPLWADDNGIKSDRLDWTAHESRHSLPERLKPAPFIFS